MGKPLVTKLTRNPRIPTRSYQVDLDRVEIPDLWPVVEALKGLDRHITAEMVLECWHLCHDMLIELKGGLDEQDRQRVQTSQNDRGGEPTQDTDKSNPNEK